MRTCDANDFPHEATLLCSILFAAFRISRTGLFKRGCCEEHAAFLGAELDVLPVSLDSFRVLWRISVTVEQYEL